MPINLGFLCMLAECQQNFRMPEHMKEGSPTYTYFLYPVTRFEPHFSRFLEYHSTFYYVKSPTHIKSVSHYFAKMKIIHSSGKVAVVVRGFTNPRPQILQAMSKFYGTWVWNLLYVSVLTPMFL